MDIRFYDLVRGVGSVLSRQLLNKFLAITEPENLLPQLQDLRTRPFPEPVKSS
jgi:hypothetical protein